MFCPSSRMVRLLIKLIRGKNKKAIAKLLFLFYIIFGMLVMVKLTVMVAINEVNHTTDYEPNDCH